MTNHRARRALPPALFLAGLGLTVCGLMILNQQANDATALQHAWDRARQSAADHPLLFSPHTGDVVAKMSVPAAGYSAVVREGVSSRILDEGPGHLPGSALPGEPGNDVIAGHNGFWWRFGSLHPGDVVAVTSTTGKRTVYAIRSEEVVAPQDVTVAAPTAVDRLTLLTCWPLWLGALAPSRLAIVALPLPLGH
jgi:LPXTG-site transpeptidase (sortase) family protein